MLPTTERRKAILLNGDISIENISEKEFKGFSPEHREWLLFSSIKSLNSTCHSRHSICCKIFLKNKNVIWAALLIAAFLLGAGYIQANVIIPGIVKAALAAM